LAYVRDISKIFASDGVLSRSVYFSMSNAQLFKSAHTHPTKIIRWIYEKSLLSSNKNIYTFFNIAI